MASRPRRLIASSSAPISIRISVVSCMGATGVSRTRRRSACRGRRDLPCVPTAMRMSPARNVSAGVGDGTTSCPRTMATMETRVRVLAFVSPSGWLRYGESVGSCSCSVKSPAVSPARLVSRLSVTELPSRSASAAASSSFSGIDSLLASGSSRLNRARSRSPSRCETTLSRRPLSVTRSWRTPMPGRSNFSIRTPTGPR